VIIPPIVKGEYIPTEIILEIAPDRCSPGRTRYDQSMTVENETGLKRAGPFTTRLLEIELQGLMVIPSVPKPGEMNGPSSRPRDVRASTAPRFSAHLHCAKERLIPSVSQLQLGCTA